MVTGGPMGAANGHLCAMPDRWVLDQGKEQVGQVGPCDREGCADVVGRSRSGNRTHRPPPSGMMGSALRFAGRTPGHGQVPW